MIAGKYRVDHVLGAGGMGVVVGATHVGLGSRVALKFLLAEMTKYPAIVERFVREARASAQLQTENVCRVMDVGATDDGIPYIVMELLQGHDLASVIKHSGPTPPPLVADWMLQVCQALAEAHALGIVHRDLKPGNLFLTQKSNGKQVVKVLDFGIAKAPTTDFNLTQTSSVMGSPGYMSPEQLKSSKAADPRSDIWSLGIVMYELLSARKPFGGETITELALKVVTEPHPPLPNVLPKQICDVVQRCLEKSPDRRYGDVAALAAALAPLVPNGAEIAMGISRMLHGANAPIAYAPAGTGVPTTLGGATGATGGAIEGKRSRAPLVVGLVAGLAGIGITAAVMLRGDGAPDPSAAPPGIAIPKPATTPPAPPDAAVAAAVPADAAIAEPVAVDAMAAVAVAVDAAVPLVADDKSKPKPKPIPKPKPKPVDINDVRK